MSDGNRSDVTALGRLAFGLVLMAMIVVVGLSLDWRGRLSGLREEAEQVPQSQCAETKDCDEKALRLQARELVSTEALLDLTVYQGLLNIFGLLGLGLTVWYAKRAWSESRRSADAAHDTLEDARRDAAEAALRFEAQLKVASDTAAAAMRQAVGAEDTARKQLRAYVHAEAMTFQWMGNEHPIFSITLNNTGQTPAIGVVCGCRHVFGERDSVAMAANIPADILLGSHGVIGAGSGQKNPVLVEGCKSIRREDITSNGMVGVVGRVRYSDVFGDTYETEFAFFAVHPDTKTMGTISGSHAMFRQIAKGAQGA